MNDIFVEEEDENREGKKSDFNHLAVFPPSFKTVDVGQKKAQQPSSKSIHTTEKSHMKH